MRWLRLTVLALLALWTSGLSVGIVANLLSDDLCSAASMQISLLGVGVACLALPFWIWRRRRGSVALGLSLLAGTGGAFICTVLGLLPAESVFPFYPAIDTQTPPDFSRAAFLSIEPGMNEAQVIELVGEPARLNMMEPGPRVEFDQAWGYSQDGACGWCDAAWRSYTVYFRAGSVWKAAEQWHCD